MSKLPQPVETRPWGVQEILRFDDAEDAVAWSEREVERWPAATEIRNSWLSKYWNQQRNAIVKIRDLANATAEAQASEQPEQAVLDRVVALQSAMTDLAGGLYLTSDHPAFPRIRAMFDVDQSAAAQIMTAWRSSGDDYLTHERVATQGPLTRAVAESLGGEEARAHIRLHADELLSLRVSYAEEIETLRDDLTKLRADSVAKAQEHATYIERRDTEWAQLVDAKEKHWDKMRKTYDEQLALEAPTTYWRNRSVESYKNARIFGWASGAVAVIAVAVFCWLGIGFITGHAKDGVFVALAPLLVPAFVAVWALKVLTRLMSDNLQLARDGLERETMVKTFLALIHDQERGRSLVTDEDRILILHSLFRPSAISSIDDAPPVHWFDLLMKRQADAAAKRNLGG